MNESLQNAFGRSQSLIDHSIEYCAICTAIPTGEGTEARKTNETQLYAIQSVFIFFFLCELNYLFRAKETCPLAAKDTHKLTGSQREQRKKNIIFYWFNSFGDFYLVKSVSVRLLDVYATDDVDIECQLWLLYWTPARRRHIQLFIAQINRNTRIRLVQCVINHYCYSDQCCRSHAFTSMAAAAAPVPIFIATKTC